MTAERVVVPHALAAFQIKFRGQAGRDWIVALPGFAAGYLRQWQLRLDGPPRHGMVALVLPVLSVDDQPAALKLQPIDEEHTGEAAALRVWNGDGAVGLLRDDPGTGTLLLERLDVDRSLADVPDDMEAVRIIGELLVRLNAHVAPPEVRRLRDVAERMVADVRRVAHALTNADAQYLRNLAGATNDVAAEAGDRLLHWDLHYENVLAGRREPWLAIDPKPLAGDPGFELLPALHNRWDDIVASGDARRAVRRRFDLMVDIMGLGRERAVAWTLARVLQNALWRIEDGESAVDPAQALIVAAISNRPPP